MNYMKELQVFPLPKWAMKTSGYGMRWGRLHAGVDYGAPVGTPVRAPWDGWVNTGNEPGGAGWWVWVTSGNYVFKCFHLSGYAAKGFVKAGTTIAFTGGAIGHAGAGSSTGAHAHMELHANGPSSVINPTEYFDRAQWGASDVLPPPSPAPVYATDNKEDDVAAQALRFTDTGNMYYFAGEGWRHVKNDRDLVRLGVLSPKPAIDMPHPDWVDVWERYPILDGPFTRPAVKQ